MSKWTENGMKGSTNGGCSLMHGCRDRQCDVTKSDCQECLKDVDDAINEWHEENNYLNMG